METPFDKWDKEALRRKLIIKAESRGRGTEGANASERVFVPEEVRQGLEARVKENLGLGQTAE